MPTVPLGGGGGGVCVCVYVESFGRKISVFTVLTFMTYRIPPTSVE